MEILSISHIIYLLITIVVLAVFYFAFRNTNKKTQFIAVYIPLVIGLTIHFLKLLIPEYRNNLPISIIDITPSTICAFATLTYPFFYFSKNERIKDYMVIMGITAGSVAIIYPYEVVGTYLFSIETIRFFVSHICILIPSLFMLLFKIHVPSKQWFSNTIVIFFIVLMIIITNNMIFRMILEGKEAMIAYLKGLIPESLKGKSNA